MKKYQKEFAEFLIDERALQFGRFKLKSGRISPYFFNTSAFNSGNTVEKLGYFYA
ncbi:MAG: orotate phosphoribosyltransferase, partial [SAR324 cluster bacterium]|nr:orotate phosphoribosyltransferase [SAR324 cluster bacterium]